MRGKTSSLGGAGKRANAEGKGGEINVFGNSSIDFTVKLVSKVYISHSIVEVKQ